LADDGLAAFEQALEASGAYEGMEIDDPQENLGEFWDKEMDDDTSSVVPNTANMSEETRSVDDEIAQPYRTETNAFGLYCVYPGGRPSYTPDGAVASFHPSDSPTLTTYLKPKPIIAHDIVPDIDYADAPFNISQHLLVDWHWSEDTANKTLGSADRLVRDVLQHPDFKKEDIMGWRGMARETQILEDYLNDPNMTMPMGDKWIKASVDIPIPSTKIKTTEEEAATYTINGIFYRRPLDVIKNKLKMPEAQSFHLFPFQEFWESPSGATPVLRTSDELYNSDVWIKEHLKVQEDSRAKGITLETVLIGLQFWSDLTLLANFGDAALWPLYAEEANLPKSIRMAASPGSMHHIAQVPKVCQVQVCTQLLPLISVNRQTMSLKHGTIQTLVQMRQRTTRHFSERRSTMLSGT
jgi:Plavaka transposase